LTEISDESLVCGLGIQRKEEEGVSAEIREGRKQQKPYVKLGFEIDGLDDGARNLLGEFLVSLNGLETGDGVENFREIFTSEELGSGQHLDGQERTSASNKRLASRSGKVATTSTGHQRGEVPQSSM